MASLPTINGRLVHSDTRKKYLRPRTRRKKYTEPDETMVHSELHHGSSDFRDNNDSIETHVGSDTTTLKGRLSKVRIKRKKQTKSGEHQNSVQLSGKLPLLEDTNDSRTQRNSVFCLDFTQSSMADEETDTHVESAVAQKTVQKSQSKEKCVDSSDNCNLSIPRRNTMKRVSDGGGSQRTSLHKVHSSKKATVLKRSTKRGQTVEPNKELQKIGVEKLKPVNLNCSLGNSGITEEDGITLASFLQNRLKKRKLQVDCLSNQDYNQSKMQNQLGFFSEGRDWCVGNSDLSDMTSSGVVVSEKLSSQMQSIHLKHKTTPLSSGNELVKDPVNSSMESNHGADEVDDICLASLRKRIKKKSQTTKSGSQACPPSFGTRESQQELKRVDNLYDENDKALVVSSEPGGLERNNIHKYLESKTEELAIDLEGNHDGCDVTLASFLKNKSKRR